MEIKSPSKAPESPLIENTPGLRRMPLLITQRSQAYDFEQEKEITKKWFDSFFDDLGAVEMQGTLA